MKNTKLYLTGIALALAVTGCASSKKSFEEITQKATDASDAASQAQQASDSATRAATRAQQTGDAANRTANDALQLARQANDTAEANKAAIAELNEKLDRMFKKAMRK